jgi:hypothetical protein
MPSCKLTVVGGGVTLQKSGRFRVRTFPFLFRWVDVRSPRLTDISLSCSQRKYVKDNE